MKKTILNERNTKKSTQCVKNQEKIIIKDIINFFVSRKKN